MPPKAFERPNVNPRCTTDYCETDSPQEKMLKLKEKAKNKKKHEAFEQRMILVFRLLEDSQIKFKIA